MKVWKSLSCAWFCDPMDYTVHGILQARILERVASPLSRGSSQPRDQTQVSRTASGFFTSWATREAQKKTGVQVNVNRYTGEGKNRMVIKFSRPEILHIIKQKYMLDFRMWYNC